MVSNVSYKFNPIALILIILGIIAVAFPLASTMTVGFLSGILFWFIAIFLFLSAVQTFAYHKLVSICSIILTIICIICGYMVIFDPLAMSSFASFITYIAGFIMIFNGISLIIFGLEFRPMIYMGILTLISGILYIIIAFYMLNPLNLGLLIGIWLILTGVLYLFMPEYKDYIDV